MRKFQIRPIPLTFKQQAMWAVGMVSLLGLGFLFAVILTSLARAD